MEIFNITIDGKNYNYLDNKTIDNINYVLFEDENARYINEYIIEDGAIKLIPISDEEVNRVTCFYFIIDSTINSFFNRIL